MDPEADPVEALFAAALAKPAADRAAYLEGACHGDDRLRQRVLALLQAHAEAAEDAFLTGPFQGGGAAEISEGPGTRIGAYKLLQKIGEGGMGVVYMAEQDEPVRRRVALKIIKPGLDSGQVIARFEAERQALAMMDHQHIARVLDAGTAPSGRPYFVMELVHGIPITQFCDQKHLSPRQRLELFIPVCQAIQHAHQKGIIHRDVKPSNVLVTLYDDKPVPKVIDFGVAKAIEQRLTEKTLFTQFGAFVGTFEYMSPEQAEMNALGVDTRSDIYSLGVLLYELLTGTTPLERKRLRQAALDEVVRLIREEEPPRPSARLSSAANLPQIAAARQTDPGRLATLLRGELDWIVMRCLEKDRARRYETASALARDAERYLHDEPVEACPPSTGYRLRKFARKHRGPLVAAGLVFLALLGGMIGTLVGWGRATQSAEREREAADHEREAKVDAQEARDNLEGALARSMISPLDPKGEEILNLAEWEALWQLTLLENDRVRLRYLEVGLTDKLMSDQLDARSAWAAQALVGLDWQRREWALAQVLHVLKDPGKNELEQSQIAWLGLELASRGSAEERQLYTVLGKQWETEKNWDRRSKRAERLAGAADRLEPAVAAKVLTSALEKETDAWARGRLAEGLAAVAPRLAPTEGQRVCALAAQLLTTALDQKTDRLARERLASGLTAVAARMAPAAGAQILTRVLEKVTDNEERMNLAGALASVAADLPLAEAQLVCAASAQYLITALDKEADARARLQLTLGLAALAGQLAPAEGQRISALAAQLLTTALKRETDRSKQDLPPGAANWRLNNLVLGLAVVAPRLAHPEAQLAAHVLTTALEKEADPLTRTNLTYGLAAMAARMPPAEGAQVLTMALEKETVAEARLNLAKGLVSAVADLPPTEARRVCTLAAQILTAALEKETQAVASRRFADGLAAVAGRLPPAERQRVSRVAVQVLTTALEKETSARVRQDLAEGLAPLAGHLASTERRHVFALAAQVMTRALKETNTDAGEAALVNGLAAVAAHLTPAEQETMISATLTSRWAGIPDNAKAIAPLLHILDNQSANHASWSLIQFLVGAPKINGPNDLDAADSLCLVVTIRELGSRATTAASAAGLTACGPLFCLAQLSTACAPLPCRFTTQQLVELLKMPTCVGEVRRILLNRLEERYHRRFASQWDFVAYAREQGLNLDFTSPPKRPPRTLPPWPGERSP
jgi:serine/threonine protein kinase